jgi:4-amino-4-deoxy-L-arabinose transferase-like glycosyltransferase
VAVLDRAWLRRTAVLVIAALAGLAYGWQANRDTLEIYYAAAVRSMSMSWHNFIFASFDPDGTVTLDKLPGAFWIQALAVRLFGVHTWVLIAPQAAEGVLTVLVLYHAVARLAGPAAGLIAAAVLLVSPATVALNRGNISDSLMILLVVLAADAVSGAIAAGPGQGRLWRLILAGVWVGLAFQAKMIEAWELLPVLALAYLIDGPDPAWTGDGPSVSYSDDEPGPVYLPAGREPIWRRARQLTAGGVVAAVVSLAWMTAVTLVPAASRPYADGSHDNSVFYQVFVYNGFGRFNDQTPLQLLAGQIRPGAVLPVAAPGPGRLLTGALGHDTGWLLLTALAVGLWALASRWRQPPGDPLRACLVLWGGWLLVLGVTFSVASVVNPYYTAALSPAVAALLGVGVTMAWSAERDPRDPSPPGDRRAAAGRRIGLAVIVAATAAYAAWLIPVGIGTNIPGWLVPAVIVAGVAATVAALASLMIRGPARFAAALAVAMVSALLTPAVASAVLIAHDQGALDTPFERPATVRAVDAFTVTLTRVQQVTALRLIDLSQGAPDLAATQTSAVAAVFIYATGREVLPIGGFDGTIPEPTVRQLQADINDRKFRLVIAFSTDNPRLAFISQVCTRTAADVYACTPQPAGGPVSSPQGPTPAGSGPAAQPGNPDEPGPPSPAPATHLAPSHPS